MTARAEDLHESVGRLITLLAHHDCWNETLRQELVLPREFPFL